MTRLLCLALCLALWLALWLVLPLGWAAGPQKRSGFADMSPATQALQLDDTLSPAALWLADGQARWLASDGISQKACATCHGPTPANLRTQVAQYPRWDAASGRAITLGQRIASCRSRHQEAAPWSLESEAALGLEAYVARQSRGLAMTPDPHPALVAPREQGRALFHQRLGQLDLSCAQCHDERAGLRLGGSTIPQGHATGYPIYRLQWQAMGSLQRRLRNCLAGVRAQAWPADAPEWVALELYLQHRAAGMPIETPAVRP